MLQLLLLVASIDSARVKPVEIDYIAPIERYIDSTMSGYDDVYDRLKEERHLREKNPHDGFLEPTHYQSPFSRTDWC